MSDADQKLARLDELFRQESRPLLGFLRGKLPNTADAEEVLQDCYLRMCQVESFDQIRDLRGFLYRVAMNSVIDRYRSAALHRTTSIDDVPTSHSLQFAAPDPSPEDHAIGAQRLAILQDAIDDLPPRCRQVFLMHRVLLLTQRAIAEELGISTQMVEKHIAKALLRCAERLRLHE